jgi:hypothetical protein
MLKPLKTCWEIDENTLGITKSKNFKPHITALFNRKKKLGLLSGCYNSSLAEKNFCSQLCSSHILAYANVKVMNCGDWGT